MHFVAAAILLIVLTLARTLDPDPTGQAVDATFAIVVAARVLWWSTSWIRLDGEYLTVAAAGRTHTVDLSHPRAVTASAGGRVAVTVTDQDGHRETVRVGLLWDHEDTLVRTLRRAAVCADRSSCWPYGRTAEGPDAPQTSPGDATPSRMR